MSLFLLLKDKGFAIAEKIVVCCDYNIRKVIQGLAVLVNGNQGILSKIEPLSEYRLRVGDDRYKSHADAFVTQAHRHIMKIGNIHKRHDVFNYCRHAVLSDVVRCLDCVLSGVKETDEKITQILPLDSPSQQILNIAELTIYQ